MFTTSSTAWPPLLAELGFVLVRFAGFACCVQAFDLSFALGWGGWLAGFAVAWTAGLAGALVGDLDGAPQATGLRGDAAGHDDLEVGLGLRRLDGAHGLADFSSDEGGEIGAGHGNEVGHGVTFRETG